MTYAKLYVRPIGSPADGGRMVNWIITAQPTSKVELDGVVMAMRISIHLSSLNAF